MNVGSVPLGLGAVFRAPAFALDRPAPILLSWDSFSCVPRCRQTCRAFAPRRCRHRRSASSLPRPPTRSTLVVSHHLGGSYRAQASGLLHPEAERSSLRFASTASTCTGPDKPTQTGAHSTRSPQRGSHPSKNSTRQVAVPCHHGRCLLVVTDVSRPPPVPKHQNRTASRADRSRGHLARGDTRPPLARPHAAPDASTQSRSPKPIHRVSHRCRAGNALTLAGPILPEQTMGPVARCRRLRRDRPGKPPQAEAYDVKSVSQRHRSAPVPQTPPHLAACHHIGRSQCGSAAHASTRPKSRAGPQRTASTCPPPRFAPPKKAASPCCRPRRTAHAARAIGQDQTGFHRSRAPPPLGAVAQVDGSLSTCAVADHPALLHRCLHGRHTKPKPDACPSALSCRGCPGADQTGACAIA